MFTCGLVRLWLAICRIELYTARCVLPPEFRRLACSKGDTEYASCLAVDRTVWLAALSSAPADVLQDDILSTLCSGWTVTNGLEDWCRISLCSFSEKILILLSVSGPCRSCSDLRLSNLSARVIKFGLKPTNLSAGVQIHVFDCLPKLARSSWSCNCQLFLS